MTRPVSESLVVIPTPTRLRTLRIARRRRIHAERVLNPLTVAEARLAVEWAEARGKVVELIVTEEMWDRPDADALADWIGRYLNPTPGPFGLPPRGQLVN